jgi:hypothetical protein
MVALVEQVLVLLPMVVVGPVLLVVSMVLQRPMVVLPVVVVW